MTCIRMLALPVGVMLIALATASTTDAQRVGGLERLPRDVLDALPPTARVRGAPGDMAVQSQPCRALPTGQTRRRIVELAAQEWAFFGFRVVDQTEVSERRAVVNGPAGEGDAGTDPRPGVRRRSRLPPEEAARVAASIAGYWAVTPEGAWIVEKQNDAWTGPDGMAARWNAPWSAAFVSWVMCEAGVGATANFQRAIAHHAYIDQAIRARDGRAPLAAFTAHDVGETQIVPGDLLCSSRRPVYRTIAERRRQLGVGARSHCDVVVQVDDAGKSILAIGGNVRGAVSLKRIRAEGGVGAPLRPRGTGGDGRPIFAHLKLRADPIAANALDATPTMNAFGCDTTAGTAALFTAANSPAAGVIGDRC